jgi:hypothetical protein
MEEDDLVVEAQPSGESCPRCLEPIPRRVARCPHCGQPISPFRRMTTIMAGVAGILALIFISVVIYRSVYIPEADQAAPAFDDQAPPDGSFAPPPETSSGHETPPSTPADSQPAAPPEAPKKPPLDR